MLSVGKVRIRFYLHFCTAMTLSSQLLTKFVFVSFYLSFTCFSLVLHTKLCFFIQVISFLLPFSFHSKACFFLLSSVFSDCPCSPHVIHCHGVGKIFFFLFFFVPESGGTAHHTSRICQVLAGWPPPSVFSDCPCLLHVTRCPG